ncbi:MFS transporter [Chromobacterium alticapitis]|uniref:MFS transporter n=1 Tax=Chromobacterium alticapitis TaxID=2073169 RepID=A0A2S5DEJ5_9NEIS|nr:MFS transporter [Chromobacterium alticapitis]POZ61408.1 MFS transporter [Chromobacterium alticapitis]
MISQDGGASYAHAARQRRAFFTLAIVQATLIFAITLVAVPLPNIGKEFGLDTASLILVNAAYGLAFSGLLLFGGRLADRFGGKPVFIAGLLVFGGASAAAALSPSFLALIAMRFLQGVGASMVAPAALSLLRGAFPEPAAFGRAMASWGSVSVLGATAGTVISGVMITWLSWRWMFMVPVAVSAFALLVQRAWLPASPERRGAEGLDLGGAVLATAGISLSSYGLILTGEAGWLSSGVMLPLLVGVALLLAFFMVERRADSPLLPPGFIAPRRLAGLIGVMLAAASMGTVSFLWSLYLQQVRGWTPLWTALGFLPYLLVLIASSRIAAPLTGRIGATRLLQGGLAIGAVGLALLAGLDRHSAYLTDLLPGLIVLPIGTAMMFASSAVIATSDVPPHQSGLAGGVMNTAMELGPTLGMAIFMSVAALRADAVEGYAWALGTAAGAFVVAALLVGKLARMRSAPEGRLATEKL